MPPVTPPEADLTNDPDYDGDDSPATAPVTSPIDDDDSGTVDDTPTRGPDGKFLKTKGNAKGPEKPEGDEEPVAEETPEAKEFKAKEAEHSKRYELLEEAKREQLKARKVSRDLERRESDITAREQQVQAYLQQREQELTARETHVAKFESVLKNPTFEALQGLGLDYQQWTRGALEAGTPEAIAKQALARADQLARQLEEEREQTKQRAEASKRADVDQHDTRMLVTLVDNNASDYPHLGGYPEETIARMGLARRDAIIARGGKATFGQVLTQLEEEVRQFEEARTARLAKRQSGQKSEGGAPANGTANTNGSVPQANARTTGKPTLTNQIAATRATPPREMTEEEKDEWAITQLKSLRRGARQ